MKRRPLPVLAPRSRRERRRADRVALRPQRWPQRPHVRLVGGEAGPYDWARRGPG